MAQRFIMPILQVFQDDGTPLPNAKLYFYETGTTTPKATYSDDLYTSANSNPVVADASGRFIANIFLKTSTGRYRVILKDENNVTIWDKDPVGLEVPASIKGARQGCIWFFSGTKQQLDDLLLDGWFICDGTNATIDMRNKYFYMNGTVGDLANTGGANTITPTATVGATAVTEGQLPVHNHVPDATPPWVCSFDTNPKDIVPSTDWTFRFATGNRSHRDTMATVGGGQAHDHDTDIGDVSNEPPFYMLIALRFGNA